MKNTRVLALAVTCAALWALAAIPASAQQLKIGVFDAERISAETAEGAKIKARLTALQERKRKELEKIQSDLQALQQEFLATSTSLSDEKRKELGLRIQRKQVELEGAQKSANQELQVEVESAQLEWQRRMLDLVRAYGKEHGYTLILPVEVVPYFSSSIDVTDELIRLVDERTAGNG